MGAKLSAAWRGERSTNPANAKRLSSSAAYLPEVSCSSADAPPRYDELSLGASAETPGDAAPATFALFADFPAPIAASNPLEAAYGRAHTMLLARVKKILTAVANGAISVTDFKFIECSDFPFSPVPSAILGLVVHCPGFTVSFVAPNSVRIQAYEGLPAGTYSSLRVAMDRARALAEQHIATGTEVALRLLDKDHVTNVTPASFSVNFKDIIDVLKSKGQWTYHWQHSFERNCILMHGVSVNGFFRDCTIKYRVPCSYGYRDRTACYSGDLTLLSSGFDLLSIVFRMASSC